MPDAWIRYRFLANFEDYRPVEFPPPGPYWCSGYSCYLDKDIPVVIAYLPKGDDLKRYWPEASEVEAMPRDEILFTDRFPRPDWWQT